MPTCPQCHNRSFPSQEALHQHMRDSSTWHPFCDDCDRPFVNEVAFDAHMAAKHPTFDCSRCSKKFAARSALDNHMAAKHPRTFDCSRCSRTFPAQFALDDHMSAKHTPTFDCSRCRKEFPARSALDQHYRDSASHPNCVRCGRGFRNSATLDEHLRTNHLRPSTTCCGLVIYDVELDVHYAYSPKHPSCTHCLRGFKDQGAYLSHIPKNHPLLHCTRCVLSFESQEMIQKHFSDSTLHPKCNRCAIGYRDADALERHHEEVHASTPPKDAIVEVIFIDPKSEPKAGDVNNAHGNLKALLRESWVCHEKPGCSSQHCYINPVDSSHFALGESQLDVWAAAMLKGAEFATLETPPKHRVFDAISDDHPDQLGSSLKPLNKTQHSNDADPRSSVMQLSSSPELVQLSRPPSPPIAAAAPLQTPPANPGPLAPAPSLIAVNPEQTSLIPTGYFPGAKMDLDEFCTEYHLTDTLRQTLNENGYCGTHTFQYVEWKDLREAGLKTGEIAQLKYAISKWSVPHGDGR